MFFEPENAFTKIEYLLLKSLSFQGYVPGHHFGFGTTYKEGTEIAVAKFKGKDHQRRVELLGLNTKAVTNQPLKVSASYPPPDISHPGTNLRYTNAYYRKKFCMFTAGVALGQGYGLLPHSQGMLPHPSEDRNSS